MTIEQTSDSVMNIKLILRNVIVDCDFQFVLVIALECYFTVKYM